METEYRVAEDPMGREYEVAEDLMGENIGGRGPDGEII